MAHSEDITRFCATLLANQVLPRRDWLELLSDSSAHEEAQHRLGELGLQLVEHPYSDYVTMRLASAYENVRGDFWSNNFGLERPAQALLVILWALLILPKRERQIKGLGTDQMQLELGERRPAEDAGVAVEESQLLADFAGVLGTKSKIQSYLRALTRTGWIVKRKERLEEGPLLDLLFDYPSAASRVIGAVTDFVKRAAPRREEDLQATLRSLGLTEEEEDDVPVS